MTRQLVDSPVSRCADKMYLESASVHTSDLPQHYLESNQCEVSHSNPQSAPSVPTSEKGSIYLRGTIWWTKIYRRGRAVRRSTKTSDRSEALSILRERFAKNGGAKPRKRISAGAYPGVYCVLNTNTGAIKIGRSRDVNRRLLMLQTGSVDGLNVICQIPTPHAARLESFLHFQFKDQRIVGEWFQISVQDIYRGLKAWFRKDQEVFL